MPVLYIRAAKVNSLWHTCVHIPAFCWLKLVCHTCSDDRAVSVNCARYNSCHMGAGLD